eukprot:14828068-Alexandrium_andersonii.AAC.1
MRTTCQDRVKVQNSAGALGDLVGRLPKWLGRTSVTESPTPEMLGGLVPLIMRIGYLEEAPLGTLG